MNIEINILVLTAYMLMAIAAGWWFSELTNRAEMRELKQENDLLTGRAFSQAHGLKLVTDDE